MINISNEATLDELQEALVVIGNGNDDVSNTQLNAIKALISLRLNEKRYNERRQNKAILSDEDREAFNII